MVGARIESGNRQRRNFLSNGDYTRSHVRYSEIRVQAIVSFVTAKYDASVTRENKFR